MVMEASPSPQSVGREFVRQYYTLLNKAPIYLHRFYNHHSSFMHGGLDAPNRDTPPVVGQIQIHNRIKQLNFRDCHAKISQVDSQATLGNGVVVQVTGELSNAGAPMRRFTQTFVLAAESPKKYYVHNDIFRYQDIVLSDEEGEGSTRSEGEDEETRGYFPPPPSALPTGGFPPAPMPPHAPPVAPPAPAPPAAPVAAPVIPPPAPVPEPAPPVPAPAPAPTSHFNGHPATVPLHDDTIRHLGATLQATTISSSVELVETMNMVESANASTPLEPPEPEPESEPEREMTPPPPQTAAAPPAAPEPKTYANLLKSGGPPAHTQPAHSRPSPPHSGAPGGGGAAGNAVAGGADTARPRMSRPPRDAQPPAENMGGAGGNSGAVSGAAGGGGAAAGGAGGGARRYSDSQQLFLGNLPHNATEEELRTLFGRFGAIAELRVHSKPAAAGGARHPNYGFITYEQPQAAYDCLSATPLYFPPDAPDAVKLNVEEKKARGGRGEAARGGRGAVRGPPSHRPPFPSRPPYRR